MYVGFHDDVAFRWNTNRTQFSTRPGVRTRRSCGRWSTGRRRRRRGPRTRPTRSTRVPLLRHRRARPQRTGARAGSDHHDLGYAQMGERRPRRTSSRRASATCRTSPAPSPHATPAATPSTHMSAATRSGTSRTCSSSSRRSSTPRGAPSARGSTRRCTRPPTPGSRPATRGAGRDRLHVLARPGQEAERQVGHALAGPLRAARGGREPAAQVPHGRSTRIRRRST